MFETRGRSAAKSFSWRIIAMAITTAVAWKVTGRFDLAASVGAVDMVVKLGVYYLHERFWSKVTFGIRPPEYQI